MAGIAAVLVWSAFGPSSARAGETVWACRLDDDNGFNGVWTPGADANLTPSNKCGQGIGLGVSATGKSVREGEPSVLEGDGAGRTEDRARLRTTA